MCASSSTASPPGSRRWRRPSRAEAEAAREREARLAAALASELAAWLADPPVPAALQRRLDELAGELGHKTDLANEKLDRDQFTLLRLVGAHREGPAPDLAAIREAVTREIDRLDGYLVHHAAELRAAIEARRDAG